MGLRMTVEVVFMSMVSRSGSECLNSDAKGKCSCKGKCTGYATRSNCPPLIVLAALAVTQTAVMHCVAAASAALKAGA